MASLERGEQDAVSTIEKLPKFLDNLKLHMLQALLSALQESVKASFAELSDRARNLHEEGLDNYVTEPDEFLATVSNLSALMSGAGAEPATTAWLVDVKAAGRQTMETRRHAERRRSAV